jgi:hypothetical protein
MNRLTEIVQWRTKSGQPVTVDDITVTPQSWTLIIRWPHGGWVWNRPVAIQAARRDHLGEGVQRIPIMDITRLAQVGLLGFSLIFLIVTFLLFLPQRRVQHE